MMKPLFLTAAALLTAGIPAMGAITVIANYRLGEADAGAASGGAGATVTVDSAGAMDLGGLGMAAFYSGVTGVSGSSLALDFSTQSAYVSAAPLTTLADNWGMEAWVQSDNGGVVAGIAYNGNSAASGMGLYQFGGNYIALVGGKAFVGASSVTSDWTHLAVVVSGGVTTFYVNGVASATGPAPNTPALAGTDYFQIGARPDLAEQFDGRIDEVRLFSFAAGAFDPVTDLQTAGVVPEPGAALLAGAGLLVAGRRRRRC